MSMSGTKITSDISKLLLIAFVSIKILIGMPSKYTNSFFGSPDKMWAVGERL